MLDSVGLARTSGQAMSRTLHLGRRMRCNGRLWHICFLGERSRRDQVPFGESRWSSDRRRGINWHKIPGIKRMMMVTKRGWAGGDLSCVCRVGL